MTIIDIKEGNTSAYVIPAVALLAAGGVAAVFIPYIGLPVLAVGLSLFLVKSGIEIDTAGCRFRKYANYFGLKIGPWHKLSPCIQVVLQLSVESQSINTYFLPGRTGSLTGKTTFKSITYDIVLTDQLGERKIFHAFLKYRTAQQALAVIADLFDVERIDRVAEKLAENRARRRR